MLSLVLGGARSGKSRFAQSLCTGGGRVAYIATARVEDAEFQTRIARHRAERPPHWLTVEEPLDIAKAVECCAKDCDFVLLDCLTLWLSNLSWERRQESEDSLRSAASAEASRLAAAARHSHLVVVSNEVGNGLVPESPLGRAFRDLQGWVNQDVARAADFVYLLVAGIPLTIKRPEAETR